MCWPTDVSVTGTIVVLPLAPPLPPWAAAVFVLSL